MSATPRGAHTLFTHWVREQYALCSWSTRTLIDSSASRVDSDESDPFSQQLAQPDTSCVTQVVYMCTWNNYKSARTNKATQCALLLLRAIPRPRPFPSRNQKSKMAFYCARAPNVQPHPLSQQQDSRLDPLQAIFIQDMVFLLLHNYSMVLGLSRLSLLMYTTLTMQNTW